MNVDDRRRAESARLAKDLRAFQKRGGNIETLPGFGEGVREGVLGGQRGAYGQPRNTAAVTLKPKHDPIDEITELADSDA